MLRVPVEEFRIAGRVRIDAGKVVVEEGRAVDNFVFAVVIDVGDREAVIAAAAVREVFRLAPIVGVERRLNFQRSVFKYVGGQRRFRIVSAREDARRPFAVEKRDRREKTVDPVAVIVAPVTF